VKIILEQKSCYIKKKREGEEQDLLIKNFIH